MLELPQLAGQGAAGGRERDYLSGSGMPQFLLPTGADDVADAQRDWRCRRWHDLTVRLPGSCVVVVHAQGFMVNSILRAVPIRENSERVTLVRST